MLTGALLLLRAILADLPQLPGAACVGHHELFDLVVGNGARYRRQEQLRRRKAAKVCTRCPVIHRCPCATTTAAGAV